jgi:hypothetical protein
MQIFEAKYSFLTDCPDADRFDFWQIFAKQSNIVAVIVVGKVDNRRVIFIVNIMFRAKQIERRIALGPAAT